MEHILVSQIMKHLEENNILTESQHGFRSKRSTETQLLLTSFDFIKSLKHAKQTDVIIMDFAKAFDKVHHERLLKKLDFYGIRGRPLLWIRNFLTHRSQRVVLDGEASSHIPVRSGVPQGTVLGPVLFLLFINDLPEEVSSKVRLFADDCILYREVTTTGDSEKLQEDLDNLLAWEQRWQMSFHPDKCKVLRVGRKRKPIIHDYTIRGHKLDSPPHEKYLGVTMQSNATWEKHINNTTSKATKTLGFLRRNLRTAPKHIKATAYTSMVRPQLEYASTVWDPHQANQIDQIEKVQRRAARFVNRDYSRESSVTLMLNQLGWQPLQHRKANARLTMFYKIVHCIVAIPPTLYLTPSNRSARGHNFTYLQQQTNANYQKYSYLPRTIVQWNRLPATVVEAPSLEVFQSRLQGVPYNTLAY